MLYLIIDSDHIYFHKNHQVDIDEILSRAEYRDEDQPTSAGDELLSAFKVCNYYLSFKM